MNTIEKLIEKLCPNGVEFKELGQILKTLKKGTLKTTELIINGRYPVINSGRGIYGRYNEFNNESNVITIAARGENAGFINYFDERFWAGGLCYPYNSFDEKIISTKFIFYFLKHNQNYIRNRLVAEGGIPALNKSEIEKFQIPVPPLAIQEKIVEILDQFTQLEIELETELEARKSQYQFYRNQLVAFENKEVEWKSLGEIGEIRRGVAFTKNQAISGKYPVVANAPIPITFHNEANRNGECVVIARSGANAGLVSYWNEEFFLTDAFSIHSDEKILKPKFIYYYLKNLQRELHLMKKGVGVPHVRVSDFEIYEIPVPAMEEQNRIVKILDQFDDLVNNISSGLPAEIKARRQQYEYYRAKLLTFKVMENH